MPSPLEEKDAIREVLAEYCFRLDDGRFAEMAALFTENGTWDTAFGRATGRAAIAELARNIRARAGDLRPRGIHLVTNISICAGRCERSGALQLDRRTEQPGGTKDRLGRSLSRRTGQSRRAMAVPLPQDRPLHRAVSPLPSPSLPRNRGGLGWGPLGDRAPRIEALDVAALGTCRRVDDGVDQRRLA